MLAILTTVFLGVLYFLFTKWREGAFPGDAEDAQKVLEPFASPLYKDMDGAHLAVMSCIAYYGDNTITESELATIEKVIDGTVSDTAHDREWAIKELIVDTLDALKSAIDQSPEDQVQGDMSRVTFDLAAAIYDTIHKAAEEEDSKDLRQPLLDLFLGHYYDVAKADGKVGKMEQKLLDGIHIAFRTPSKKQQFIYPAIVVSSAVLINVIF